MSNTGRRPQQLTILGATGSIGVNTLRVVAAHSDRYRIFALTAHRNTELLAEQCLAFSPVYAVTADAAEAARLSERLRASACSTRVLAGTQALAEVAAAPEVDVVMAAIVGGAGLLPTLAAARAGKRVLLANKEALVMAGTLFMQAARAGGAQILPIDSEHNAIFQCLPLDAHGRPQAGAQHGVSRIVLTASGGPFREMPLEALADVTPDQACAHPNWQMGRKISVDSATMINKALELIEASYLFDTPPERIDIVVHPQSIVHSMVYYHDGSVLAQLGNPDMRTPIAHALAWPQRIGAGVEALDLVRLGRLDFAPADPHRFPGLALGRQAAEARGAAPIIFNAANEIAVAAFLQGRLGFAGIPAIIDRVLQQLDCTPPCDLGEVLDIDARARALAAAAVPGGSSGKNCTNP